MGNSIAWCVGPDGAPGESWNDELRRRFWRNVQKGADCWEWTAGLFGNGYGQFRAGARKVRAHRAVYEMECGPIPVGVFVCHHCDNRKCVRPEHLFLGTAADNAHDRDNKGRARAIGTPQPGESNPAAKMKQADVSEIRALHDAGFSQRCIARRFRISQAQVANIIHGRCWRAA